MRGAVSVPLFCVLYEWYTDYGKAPYIYLLKLFGMKKLLFCMGLLMFLGMSAYAQTTTYILLRHAEKAEVAPGNAMMSADPPLSEQGEKRAANLVNVLKDFTPDLFYTTNYKRTKSTIAHLTTKFGKEAIVYEPRNLKAFSEKLLQEKGKTIIVAGHSNTSPALANLLIGENRYEPLDESIYNQFWIITLKDGGKPEAKIVTY